MNYKMVILFSIVFIISLSAVSAEDMGNQTIIGVDDSIDVLSQEGDTTNEGTFSEFQKIVYEASDNGTITLNKSYSYDDGFIRNTTGISIYKDLTIDGNGHTFDGKKTSRIFSISNEAKKVTLTNIQFINAGGECNGGGGAILAYNTQLTIMNCTFIDNRIEAGTGGAIAINHAVGTLISDCTFTGNCAVGVGGAVSIVGNKTIVENCKFTNNEATKFLGGALILLGHDNIARNNYFQDNFAGRDGGALDVEGVIDSTQGERNIVTNNTFIGNRAAFGGALGLNSINATISFNTFINNSAVNRSDDDLDDDEEIAFWGLGGAIRLMGEKNNETTTGLRVTKIYNNTFIGNTAFRQGGAIYYEETNMSIFDNTFTNNHAETDCGGTITAKGADPTISNNVITVSSTPNSGGAIYCRGDHAKITGNTITQASSTGENGGAIHIQGVSTYVADNKLYGNKGTDLGGAIFIKGENAVVENNDFDNNEAANAGALYVETEDGKISNNNFTNNKATTRAGALIVRNIGTSTKDTKIIENKFISNNADTQAGAICIQDIITTISTNVITNNHAKNDGGGSIAIFADNSTVSNNQISETSSPKSGGAIFVKGNNAKIIDNAITKATSRENGGAIHIQGTSATVSENKLVDNSAGDLGGAVFVKGENAVVENNDFDNNEAANAGALYVETEDGKISNNNFTNNEASTRGGALIVKNIGTSTKDTKITSNKFDGNIANTQGGAICVQNIITTISNNKITNNNAKTDCGGSIVIFGSDSTILDNEISSTSSYNSGGAIYCKGDNTKIIGNTISDANTKQYGGAINVQGASTTISNNIILNSTAGDLGGAVYLSGVNAVIDNNIFNNNRVNVSGGAIHIESAGAKITNNNFTNNVGKTRAGALNVKNSESIAVSYNNFENNIGENTAGAIYMDSNNAAAIGNNFISNKVVKDEGGGAIRWIGNNANIKSNTFAKNTAKIGYAIFGKGSNPKINGNTFIGGKISDSTVHWSGASLDNNTFIDELISTKLISSDVTTVYNGDKNLIATLKDVNGKAIKDAQVKILLGGVTKTLTTDANGQVSLSTDSLVPNTYTATITFDGNDAYKASSTTAKVTVNKLDTMLTAKYDASSKNIVATVKDANGNPVSGLKVGFAIDGVKYVTTDDNGQAKYSTANLPEKTYNVNVMAYGNEIYKDSNKETVTFSLIKISTTLTASDVTTVYKGGKNLVATLKDSNGKAIKDAQVKILLGGVTKTLTTDANGQVSLSTDSLVPNTYTATITFDGNDAYKASSTTAKVTVNKLDTMLTAKYDASSKNIVATVKDANGNPVSGLKVGFAIDGVKYVTTDDNGQAKYSTANLPEKTYNVNVMAYGNEIYKDSNKETVTVSSTKISTTLNVSDVTTVYKGGKNLVATLKDSNGKAIKDAQVKILLGGVTKTLTTDANGQVSLSTDSLVPNTYTATITFDGNDIYEKSSASATVVVNKQQSKIYLRNALYFVLQTKYVTVTLWDANNTPIAGKTVYITLNEFGWKYSGVTDENGNAVIRVGVGFGVHPATVSFEGDDQYNASERTGSIRVIKETPSVMVRGADTQFKVSASSKIVKVYLWDRTSKPLPVGSKIFIKINGQTFVGTTDSGGIAHVKINVNHAGTFNAQAIYAGNSAYNAVKRDIKIVIK